MNTKKIIAIALASILAVAVAYGAHGHKEKRLMKMEKRMEQHILLRLSDEMELDEEKLLKINGAFKKAREKRHHVLRELKKIEKELRAMLDDNSTADATFKKTVARVKKLRNQIRQIEIEKTGKIEKLLSSREAAQYILLMNEFKHRMLKGMRKGECYGQRKDRKE